VKAVFRPQFWVDLEDGVACLTTNASVETARRDAGYFGRVEHQPASELAVRDGMSIDPDR
jgi:hypothetical protein